MPSPEIILQYSRLLILEWLPPGDLRTGKQLSERLLARSVHVEIIQCRSAQEVLINIELAAREIKTRGIPIIHIEAHGDDGNEYPRGLIGPGIGTSSEILEWDHLAPLLRKVNLASEFNLIVVAAACFGEAVVLTTRPFEAAPFVACFGFADKVNSSSLREAMIALYLELFERHRSLEDAVNAANRELYDASEKLVLTPVFEFIVGMTAHIIAGRQSPEGRFLASVRTAASLDLMGAPGMFRLVHGFAVKSDYNSVKKSLRTVLAYDQLPQNRKRFGIYEDKMIRDIRRHVKALMTK